MSRNFRKVSPVTKSCKVCKDVGLPERMYMDHTVKNEKGQVCCPTLKSVCCRNCDNMGHTEKYCKVAASENVKRVDAIKRRREHEEVNVEKKVGVAKKSANVFDSLMDADSDDEPPANVTMRKPVAPPANVTMRKPIAGLNVPEKKGFIPLSEWLATSPKTPSAKKTASIAPWAPMKKTSCIAPWALGKDSDKPVKKSWIDLSDEEDNTAW